LTLTPPQKNHGGTKKWSNFLPGGTNADASHPVLPCHFILPLSVIYEHTATPACYILSSAACGNSISKNLGESERNICSQPPTCLHASNDPPHCCDTRASGGGHAIRTLTQRSIAANSSSVSAPSDGSNQDSPCLSLSTNVRRKKTKKKKQSSTERAKNVNHTPLTSTTPPLSSTTSLFRAYCCTNALERPAMPKKSWIQMQHAAAPRDSLRGSLGGHFPSTPKLLRAAKLGYHISAISQPRQRHTGEKQPTRQGRERKKERKKN